MVYNKICQGVTRLRFFFVWTLKFSEYRFGGKNAKITTNLKWPQKKVNQIFNPHAFFFFLSTGATWFYYDIYIVFTYFVSLTGYENDKSKVIFNFHVQGSKFGGKFEKFGRNSF